MFVGTFKDILLYVCKHFVEVSNIRFVCMYMQRYIRRKLENGIEDIYALCKEA